MTKEAICYGRAPSKELCALLAPGEFLSPIRCLHNKREVQGLALDVHFRGDVIHVYCGLTRLFDVRRMRRTGNLRLDAHEEHRKYDKECIFFREWRTDDGKFNEFRSSMEIYLNDVKISSRHSKEGRVQMNWSRVATPWMSFDRECRLKYCSREYRRKTAIFPEVDAAYERLCSNYENHRSGVYRKRWAKAEKKATKLDRLAVDHDGRLVLIELKDAESGKKDDVYYSPFQLLQYVWEWHEALKNSGMLLAQLQSLLNMRVDLLRLPEPRRTLTGCIRPAVCFGLDGRSTEVRQRFAFVLNICNEHLPEGVGPIETWEYRDGAPCRIL